MFEKVYAWFVVFFSMLALFGFYIGLLGLFVKSVAFFVILICAFCACYVVKDYGATLSKFKYGKHLFMILLVFALALLYPMSSFIFPNACSDLELHALATRYISYNDGFVKPHFAIIRIHFKYSHIAGQPFFVISQAGHCHSPVSPCIR